MASNIRRVVTGHDKNGKAIVTMDGDAKNVKVRQATGICATLLWRTDATPAELTDADPTQGESGVAPPLTGSIFRIVEFPPEKAQAGGASSEEVLREMGVTAGDATPRHPAMHRTQSVDYAIVLKGEIDMLLDDSEVHLKAGDVIVQQGTNHAWANRGSEPCQIAFVLIGARVPWASEDAKPH